ncbi:hypothetical protein [Hymenobacter glacieicola]|uniref:Uncharacterized protein n=1 Tax=Hymenobacter glacieicola TaxID=1562124 RepID=A0ABQ1WLL7_9BACT|nr:hypothetical protein [Hymenobacter glacieicola]GGG33268.1 hypothetical protein GCM10011378_07120 [Hymenobacter glacieicola]
MELSLSQAQAIYEQAEAHKEIIQEVLLERVRQDNKFGPQNRPPFEWKIILDEEVGEVSHEVCEVYFRGEEFSDKYRKELVEVAAVALAALQNYDQRAAAASSSNS